jgi:bisphosphoglycerate-independent phosphoglycerate mutase (AlkP superfamily)
MDPSVVPGVLLLNRKLTTDGHDLTDLTATLLSHYGVPKPAAMTGEPIL